MTISRHLRWALGAASVLLLCGCGSGHGGTDLSGARTAAATATVARYVEALRRNDPGGVRAVLAPDYSYDPGSLLSDPTSFFNRPAGIRYHSLSYRLESLTGVENTVTTTVRTQFTGDLNLQILSLGQPFVTGTSVVALESEPRGGEWKLTAIRPIRVTYSNPQIPLPPGVFLAGPVTTLPDYTVNGQTAQRVPPGAPLHLAGNSIAAQFVAGLISSNLKTQQLQVDPQAPLRLQPWRLDLEAPAEPGRFLAYALTLVLLPDPRTGQVAFFAGDQATIPVTVVNPP